MTTPKLSKVFAEGLVQLRSGFNYDRDAVSLETGLKCEDVSRTIQSAAEEADINTIVNRFLRTGEMPSNVRPMTYGDFDEIHDFQTAMNAIREANQNFLAMPAQIRARFHNDPQEFMEFCSDAQNFDEAVKLGLAMPKAPPATPTPPAPSGAASAPSGQTSNDSDKGGQQPTK